MTDKNPAPLDLTDSRDQAYEAVRALLAEWLPHTKEGHLGSVAAAVVVAVEDTLVPAALMASRENLNKVAERLKAKAKETGDKSHLGTAAGVHLSCFRLIELADRHARVEHSHG